MMMDEDAGEGKWVTFPKLPKFKLIPESETAYARQH